jgi:hypothetical protein
LRCLAPAGAGTVHSLEWTAYASPPWCCCWCLVVVSESNGCCLRVFRQTSHSSSGSGSGSGRLVYMYLARASRWRAVRPCRASRGDGKPNARGWVGRGERRARAVRPWLIIITAGSRRDRLRANHARLRIDLDVTVFSSDRRLLRATSSKDLQIKASKPHLQVQLQKMKAQTLSSTPARNSIWASISDVDPTETFYPPVLASSFRR